MVKLRLLRRHAVLHEDMVTSIFQFNGGVRTILQNQISDRRSSSFSCSCKYPQNSKVDDGALPGALGRTTCLGERDGRIFEADWSRAGAV